MGLMTNQEQYYSCSLHGIKRYFRSKNLTSKMINKIEKALDASDTKRQDVKKVYIRYTREAQLGYKLVRKRS